jgi:hypothetical protein
MKIVREIYDFVAGGSIVAPLGLAVALGTAFLTPNVDAPLRAGIFLTLLAITFIASAFEASG